jgi:hypothetical protein
MRTIMALILVTLTGVACAHMVVLSKKEIIEIIESAAVESTCTPELTACLELSKATCTSEVGKLAWGTCSKYVPEGDTAGDAVSEIAEDASKCIVTGVITPRKENLAKNQDTAACQAFLK